MLSVKLRLLQQFFLPVLFEASDRICAAGGEVSSHPQIRRVERDILVIVYYASQKVCLGGIWRTVAVCLEGLASALDSQVPESCWGMLERVRIELPGGAGVAEVDVALVYVPRLSRAHKLIPILKMAPAGVPGPSDRQVYVHTRGAFAVASAAYDSQRVAAGMIRVIHRLRL